jgi:hypothetical protein
MFEIMLDLFLLLDLLMEFKMDLGHPYIHFVLILQKIHIPNNKLI